MFDLAKLLSGHEQCLELKPGERKIIYYCWEKYFTKQYIVARELDGTYSIPLYFNFVPRPDYDGGLKKEEVHDHYTKRVQRCIEKANKKMIGPNGEKFRIIVNSPEPSLENSRCKGIDIYIDSKDYRSDARGYASDIICNEITYEVLHNFGLQDEYRERLIGFYINRHTEEAEFGVNLQKDRQRDLIAEKEADPNYYFEPKYNCRVLQDHSIMGNSYERWHFAFENTPHWFGQRNSVRSLLDNGHFNKIIYGECPTKNGIFNK